MPLLKRRRVLGAKIETVVGAAESLAAADAAFNVFDSMINPQIDFEQREGQGVFSPLPGVLGAHGGQCSFVVELHGSGSGPSPVPAWASAFLPACGFVDAANVFSPETTAPEAPGAGTKTLTMGSYVDGVLKMLRGCMGTFVMTFPVGKPVRLEFTFTGLWVAPTDVAILAPNYPIVVPPRFASAGFSLGGWNPKLSEMSLDVGNEVVLREDPNDATAYHSALIVDRRITGSINPEEELVASEDVYGDWLAGTEKALATTLNGGAGNTIALAAPKVQYVNPQEADRDKRVVTDIEFQCNRNADAGDDEATLTFS